MGEGHARSTSNCVSVHAQARKHSDSYRLLMGKCPDCHQRRTSWAVSNRFAIATNKRTTPGLESLDTDQNAIGRASNRRTKAPNPRLVTSSNGAFNKPNQGVIESLARRLNDWTDAKANHQLRGRSEPEAKQPKTVEEFHSSLKN